MPPFVSAWEVDTEVEFDGSLHAITLILCFPKDFPFSIPKIYLSGKDYEKLKFIPHIDTDKFICTFRLDTIILDYKRPEVIVRDCLAQAKKNISDGKKGTNIDDYADEYLAYWKLRYPEEEPPTGSCLDMIENEIDEICFIKFGEFKQAIGKYTSCIYIEDDSYHNFSANLGYMGNTVVYINEALYFPVFPDGMEKPPFNKTYEETLTIVETLGDNAVQNFKKYMDSWKFPPFLFFKKCINDDKYIIGWVYEQPFKKKVNGFRDGAFKPFMQMRSHLKNCSVKRISTEAINAKRMMKRTSGTINYPSLSFSVAGLGSIGSNLVYFLNSYNPEEVRLVDNGSLDVENVYRHLLGLNHTGQNKVDAIKIYLTGKNPKQRIQTSTDSIISLLNTKPEFINETDYFFVTIGNENIDQYIGLALTNGIINTSTFMIWVEPYLVGGHCLFFPKNTSSTYDSLLDGLFYKNNVVNKQEFLSQNKNLSLSEAGCQSCYVPYGGSDVMLFLSALFPKIDDILKDKAKKATGFTWFGDLSILSSKGIKESDFAKEHGEAGKIIQYDI